MTDSQFSNNILPVLLGMTRLPELADHQILIRHVILDIESGKFSRAIQTLERAHAVFELSPLNDLRRFITNHSDAIALEVDTKPWRDVVSLINQPVRRWLRLTEAHEVTHLLKSCRSIKPTPNVSAAFLYEHPIEHAAKPTMSTVTPKRAQPLRLATHVQENVHTKPTEIRVRNRINFRVAFDTFIVTLLLAVLASWLLK